MEDEISILTHKSLFNLLRTQKKHEPLLKIDKDFYVSVKIFLKDSKEKLSILNNSDEILKEKQKLKNSKKLINEIFELRFSKISKIYLSNSLIDENLLSKDNILKEEKSLFDNFDNLINDFTKKYL